MSRPVLHPHYDCLKHWREIPCKGCLYEQPAYRAYRGGYLRWRIKQPFRALFYRLVVRFEYTA